MSDWVVGRFTLIGTMEDFRDITGTKSYEYYSASLSYRAWRMCCAAEF